MSEQYAFERIVATKSATGLLRKLQEDHGPVILYQARGCFARTDLICFPKREFLPSSIEVKVGEIAGAAFYIRRTELDILGRHQLVVDAGPGSGGLFSMERRLGVRFLTRLRRIPRITS